MSPAEHMPTSVLLGSLALTLCVPVIVGCLACAVLWITVRRP